MPREPGFPQIFGCGQRGRPSSELLLVGRKAESSSRRAYRALMLSLSGPIGCLTWLWMHRAVTAGNHRTELLPQLHSHSLALGHTLLRVECLDTCLIDKAILECFVTNASTVSRAHSTRSDYRPPTADLERRNSSRALRLSVPAKLARPGQDVPRPSDIALKVAGT